MAKCLIESSLLLIPELTIAKPLGTSEKTRTEMTPKQQLESILSNQYESEDGDLDKVELLDNERDRKPKSQLPNNTLPNEIEELLRVKALNSKNSIRCIWSGFEEFKKTRRRWI